MDGTAWSLNVVDMTTGRTVASHASGVPRIPASNVKIITAAAALLTFGPEHRFATSVHVDGHTVVVRGGGDPALGPQAVEDIARAVAPAMTGAPCVPRVLMDLGLYAAFTPAPGWSADLLPWEARPVVPVAPPGHRSTAPHLRTGMQVAAAIGRRTHGAVLAGTGPVPPGARCVVQVPSDAVAALVGRMLLDSESDVAEVLARNVAIARGLPATWGGVRDGLEGTLRDAGFDLSGCAFPDGSGLSRRAALRADLVTDLLVAAADRSRHPVLGLIADALPVAGLTGTLDPAAGWFPRGSHPAAIGRVRAKTGTLRDVTALSGYVDRDDGQRWAFSVMVNDCDARASRDAVASLAAGLAS